MEFSFLYPFWRLHYWIVEIWLDYLEAPLKFMGTSINIYLLDPMEKEEIIVLESIFISSNHFCFSDFWICLLYFEKTRAG